MKKLILIILMLFLPIAANAFEEIKSLSQLKEHKLIFLAFEKDGCPWCSKYKDELRSTITKKYEADIKFFKAKKGSKIFSQLRKELGVKIIIYPMTYILKLDDNNNSKIVHEIYGYQTTEYMEELFSKKLLINR